MSRVHEPDGFLPEGSWKEMLSSLKIPKVDWELPNSGDFSKVFI